MLDEGSNDNRPLTFAASRTAYQKIFHEQIFAKKSRADFARTGIEVHREKGWRAIAFKTLFHLTKHFKRSGL